MKKAFLTCLAWTLLAGAATPAVSATRADTAPEEPSGPPRPHLDLGFEAPDCQGGWYLGGRGYDAGRDDSAPQAGRRSARLRWQGKTAWKSGDEGFGVATQSVNAQALAGRKLRYSGYLRTEGITKGDAGLWIRVDGASGTLQFANLEGRGPKGTTPWTRYDVDVEVPDGAKEIYFGATLVGDGTVWVDSLSFTVDGQPWTEGPRLEPPALDEPAVAWLRERAIPFTTAEAGSGFADLQPLKKLIGDARIVALGEATHGTREFFQMKHRLTELLATEMGFTIFSIEASMPEAYRLNEYVLTGEGDPRELLRGMYFWTWDTQEVLDMILWMREFNRSGKGRIQFTGFDMQYPGVAVANVKKLVGEARPELLPRLEEAYAPFADWEASRGPAEPARTAARLAGAQKALEIAESARGPLTARLGREKAEWAVQNARVALQTAEMAARKTGRDRSMAKNVEWILDQAGPDAKIVLWAHNGHVYRKEPMMGHYLARRYPREMVVLGFAFYQGRYTAVGEAGLGQHDAAPAMNGSVESYLHAAGLPRFVLDLRNLPAGAPSSPWLAEPRPLRMIGAVATNCVYMPSVVAEEYDALIYFDQTNPSALFPRPPRPTPTPAPAPAPTPAPAAASSPFLDLGFERTGCTGPWKVEDNLNPDYELSFADAAQAGSTSLRLRYRGASPWKQESQKFGVVSQPFPVEAAAGQRIRFSGYLRSEGIANGWAGLWLRVDGPDGALGFDNMEPRGVKGTTPWTRYDIELDVPAGARAIYFGALLVGDGTLWVDSLSFEIGGKRYEDVPPPSPAPSAAMAAAVAWLKERAVPFATAEPGGGFSDLQPWKKLIGGARIVSLGEATHGSREFFQMKDRLTRFLATEMGFTHFAIEANMPEAYRVNEYVLTGKGDPKELLKGMYFWTWNTQEVLDMILWMREFNRSGKGRIQFHGFDMQTPTVAVETVKRMAAEASPELASRLEAAYAPFADWETLRQSRARPSAEKAKELFEGAQKALALVEAAREKLVARHGKEQAEWAVHNARLAFQVGDMHHSQRGWVRDENMAKNVEWILDHAEPGAKIVLWAHNRHAFRKEGFMGWHLGRRYPKEMVVLGFAFHEGGYNAIGDAGLAAHEAAPAVPESVEAYFHAAGVPRFVLDLRNLPADAPSAPWLAQPRPFRSLGSRAFRCSYDETVVSQLYDGLIYFDKVAPSTLLPR
ncbi:MAG TPA: erythromycin esterase family protein [Thermoanaerobaculia bacterium]|nr:erythromycin esterase family protein [Thermoanaerobaculia bacterium]